VLAQLSLPDGTRLLSRVALGIAPGLSVVAQVKSVAPLA
jgi:hypothetical protein